MACDSIFMSKLNRFDESRTLMHSLHILRMLCVEKVDIGSIWCVCVSFSIIVSGFVLFRLIHVSCILCQNDYMKLV